VGAEICLLLSRLAHDIELVAVCRNRSGSAYLRWQGIACRHGRPADPVDAARLYGDCDIILNFALAGGNPAQIRRTEQQLIHNCFEFSKPDARIVYFSTQSVYGDPRLGRLVRWRNPYGRGKLSAESRVRAERRHWRKEAYVLRLGHVCGELQNISLDIRRDLLQERAALPAADLPSNTVLTIAIVDAIEEIVAGRVTPNTYDLMNTPQWTWRQVYDYEAQRCGVATAPTVIRDVAKGDAVHGNTAYGEAAGSSNEASAGSGLRLIAKRSIRELVAKLLAYAPEAVSRRAQAIWYRQRASAEIHSLTRVRRAAPADHLSWIANGRRPLPQRPTVELLASDPYQALGYQDPMHSWPADLPDAQSCNPP
jgi:nucleoside-diphosphate-sugar epimerase